MSFVELTINQGQEVAGVHASTFPHTYKFIKEPQGMTSVEAQRLQ